MPDSLAILTSSGEDVEVLRVVMSLEASHYGHQKELLVSWFMQQFP